MLYRLLMNCYFFLSSLTFVYLIAIPLLTMRCYADASEKVSVVWRDPVLYPTFTSEYTTEDLPDNSLILTYCDDYRVIDYNDLYELDSATYSYQFDGESTITNAIIALTSDSLPTVYQLSGHSSTTLSSTVSAAVEDANIQLEELNLLSEGDVPDDADAVAIVSPELALTSISFPSTASSACSATAMTWQAFPSS